MDTAQTRVIGLGAGGHAKVVLEALRAAGGFEVVGLLDPRGALHGDELLGAPVLGGDELLRPHYDDGVRTVFIGLGGVADTRPRQELYERARAAGFTAARVVHPAAVVSGSARLGEGAQVLAAAVVGPDAEVGENAIVNTAAVVEHDCRVGAHAHVAPGATLASAVDVGAGAHVGAGATVLQGVRLGAACVVGAGAVVLQDVAAGAVVVGVPARALERDGGGA